MTKNYEYFDTIEHVEDAFVLYSEEMPYERLTAEATAAVEAKAAETGKSAEYLQELLSNRLSYAIRR